jgi:hypothetical protein
VSYSGPATSVSVSLLGVGGTDGSIIAFECTK